MINRSRVRLPAVHCRVSIRMGDRLWADKPSRYVTSYPVNSAFHPSRICESKIGLDLAGVKAGCVRLFQVAGNTVWSHGKWRFVVLRWSFTKSCTQLNLLGSWIILSCCDGEDESRDACTLYDVQEWEVVVLQALKWDVAAVTAGDFVDVILCQLSMLNVNTSQRRALVRQHALTYVVLCALGSILLSRRQKFSDLLHLVTLCYWLITFWSENITVLALAKLWKTYG